MVAALNLPLIWPTPLQVAPNATHAAQPVFASVVQHAVSLYGVLCAPGPLALSWHIERLKPTNGLTSTLILALYPSGPTTADDLAQLLEFQREWVPNVEFRIHVLDHLAQRSASILLFFDYDETTTLVSSSDPDLGLGNIDASQLGVADRASPLLRDQLVNSMNLLWAFSAPLTKATAAIPRLTPGPDEDGRGRADWFAYKAACKARQAPTIVVATPDTKPKPGDILVDSDTGAVKLIDADGKEEQPPSDDLSLPKLDALQRVLASLQEKGDLVTIEAASRVPPLETSAKPEWFGMERSRQEGAINQETKFHVSPFEDDVLRILNDLRGKPSNLLPAYSLPLGTGVRWMPRRARKLFESELKIAQDSWNERIASDVGQDVKAYVDSRRAKLQTDANAICARVKSGSSVSTGALDEILRAVTERVTAAIGASLMPKISYSKLEFQLDESEFSNPWGQAYTFTLAAVTEPRRIRSKKIHRAKANLSAWT